jgi:putative SOS response-associated peptidase YedK
MTKGQAIRELTRAMRDSTGNVPPLPGIFPDGMGPVVANAPDGERELTMMRWGMPGPPQFGGVPITNIRNTASPHWRRWLEPASRCLVPVTSFREYEDSKPRKTATWFALDDTRPLFCFAGIWTPWQGVRGTKANPVEGEHRLYGFLTTEAKPWWAPSTPRPCLRTAEEMDVWMRAPLAEAGHYSGRRRMRPL